MSLHQLQCHQIEPVHVIRTADVSRFMNKTILFYSVELNIYMQTICHRENFLLLLECYCPMCGCMNGQYHSFKSLCKILLLQLEMHLKVDWYYYKKQIQKYIFPLINYVLLFNLFGAISSIIEFHVLTFIARHLCQGCAYININAPKCS